MEKVQEYLKGMPSAEKWLEENEDKWERDENDYIVFLVPEKEIPANVRQYAEVENFTLDEAERIIEYSNKIGG